MAQLNPSLWRPATNLNALVLENQLVSVIDLFRAASAVGAEQITGRRFLNCRLDGPAVLLAMEGLTFDNCHLGNADGDIRKLLLKPMSDDAVAGVIPFRDCAFDGCAFTAIGFTGPQAFLNQFLQIT